MMKTHKLLWVITFVCLLFTFKMCTNVENIEYDLILQQKENLDLLSDLSDIKHETYKYKKQYDSINKLYQKAIYVKPIIKKPYTKSIVNDSIQIKDTL